MSVAQAWEAVRHATEEIVNNKPAFDTVVRSCPYFEGWWRVELSRRFANGTEGKYDLAGFDVIAICGAKRGWALDLLLDRRSGNKLEIIWTELKLLNLVRNKPVAEAILRKKLGAGLSAICADFSHVWKCARSVDPVLTARRFAEKRDLQNFTLKPHHLNEATKRYPKANHIAAAFMLAVIPKDGDWEERFWKLMDRRVLVAARKDGARIFPNDRSAPLRTTESYNVHLIGVIGAIPKSS